MLETLDPDACWTLLPTETIGRLAVSTVDGPDLFVLTYLVHERTIVFRSAPGTKLEALAADPRVAFEVDGTAADGHRWSVVLRGHARRLDADDEIEASRVLGLETHVGGQRWNVVRITPEVVSGRRL